MKEIFVPIKDYQGLYEIINLCIEGLPISRSHENKVPDIPLQPKILISEPQKTHGTKHVSLVGHQAVQLLPATVQHQRRI